MGKKGRKNKQPKNNGGAHAKSLSAHTVDIRMDPSQDQYARIFQKNMKDVPPEDIIERVRKGMCMSTLIITDLLACGNNNSEKGNAAKNRVKVQHQKYLQRLLDAGLISVVLAILQRCQTESLDDVIETDGICGVAIGNKVFSLPEEKMESRVTRPDVWVCMLVNLASHFSLGSKQLDEIRMQIAGDIGPLVSCMSDDMKRELFQSKEYWFGALHPFVQLVYSLAVTKTTIPILMSYDGLREFMVGCIFYGIHRPDIIADAAPFKEDVMKPDAIAYAADYAGAYLGLLLKSHYKEGEDKFYFEGQGKELNYNIGTAPIVSRSYDPSCGLICVSGLIGLLKGDNTTNEILASPNFFKKEDIQSTVTMLIVGGCVDKTTIEEVIDLGLNHASTYDDARWITKSAHEMTHDFEREGKLCPKDKYVATAVEAGLFDMLLNFLVAYGDYTDSREMNFVLAAYSNVQAVCGAALSKHTSKALRVVRPKVMTALQSPQLQRLASKHARSIVESMQSLFSMSSKSKSNSSNQHLRGNVCNQCTKFLPESKVLYCSKCKCVRYCSKDCQIADWKSGHKQLCGTMKNHKEVKNNVCNMAENFVDENETNLVLEASLRGYDMLDCLVVVNCSLMPPMSK